MLAVKTILHPTDFSKDANLAFRLACSLARDYGATLIVLHVATPPDLIYYGPNGIPLPPEEYQVVPREQLEQLQPRHANVPLVRRLVEGDPATEILRAAADVKADVIVMGTHGRTGLGRVLMGSVAEKVVRKAGCPVLTVKMPVAAAEAASQPAQEATEQTMEVAKG